MQPVASPATIANRLAAYGRCLAYEQMMRENTNTALKILPSIRALWTEGDRRDFTVILREVNYARHLSIRILGSTLVWTETVATGNSDAYTDAAELLLEQARHHDDRLGWLADTVLKAMTTLPGDRGEPPHLPADLN